MSVPQTSPLPASPAGSFFIRRVHGLSSGIGVIAGLDPAMKSITAPSDSEAVEWLELHAAEREWNGCPDQVRA